MSAAPTPSIARRWDHEEFGDRHGREVSYEADAPDDYFGVIAPPIGNGTAVGLAANYRAMAKLPGR